MKNRGIPRRKFLELMGIVCSGAILGACSSRGGEEKKEETKAPVKMVVPQKFPTVTPIVESGLLNAFGRELLSDAAAPEDQVLYESADEPAHLDAARDKYEAQAVLRWGTESLLRLDRNWEPVPGLAESYTEGPNAEYFDFKIREGAEWSDGTPITADDFVFTYHHLSHPALGNPWIWFFFDIKGIKARWMGEIGPEAIGVEALDERTLRIRGEGPVPHLPQMLAVLGTTPVPKHVAENDPEHWADTAEGFLSCGPYQLVKWERGKRLEWGANPHYNGPRQPAVEGVVQLLEEPENGWYWAWKERKIDLLHDLGWANAKIVQSTAVLVQQLHFLRSVHTEYLALDTMNPPLDNLKLRQALSQAIDREKFCHSLLSHVPVPAYSMLLPEFPAYNEELQSLQAYDLEKAKALLAEAGYPEGKDADGNQLELELVLNGSDTYKALLNEHWGPVNRTKGTSEFVKEQWEENLAIKVNVKTLEGTDWKKKRAERALQVYIGSYRCDYRDPANLLGWLWRSADAKGSMYHAWKNDAFDQLAREATSTVEHEKRMAKFQEAERILVEDVGAVFFTHHLIYTVWWPHITGIPYTDDGYQVYRADRTPYQMYIRNDFGAWREQKGTTATGDRHTPPTAVIER